MNLKNWALFIVMIFAFKASAEVQEKTIQGRKIVDFYFSPLSVLINETKKQFPKLEDLEKLKLQERNLNYIHAEVQKGIELIQPTLAARESDIVFLEGEIAFLKARADARSDFSRISYMQLAQQLTQEHALISEHLLSLREVKDPITEEIATLKALAKEYIFEIENNKDVSLKATITKDLYNKYVDKFVDILLEKIRMINAAQLPLVQPAENNTEVDLSMGILDAHHCTDVILQLRPGTERHPAPKVTYKRDHLVSLISGRPTSMKALKIVCQNIRRESLPSYVYDALANVLTIFWGAPYQPSLDRVIEAIK